MANELVFVASSNNNHYAQEGGGGFGTGVACIVGYYPVSGDGVWSGALRFTGINVAKNTTVNEAILGFWGDVVERSDQIKAIVYGIDEDNTGDFSSSPMGRTRTSNNSGGVSWSSGNGEYWKINVTSAVNEILQRNGWSSGNAMGFLIIDNGTSTSNENWYDDYAGGGNNSYLSLSIGSPPNLKPTPKTVSAPTFPDTDDYGLKISQPGIDVKTATEDQLLFTTRKDTLKIHKESSESVTGGVLKNIPHGLSYRPHALVYARKNNRSFSFPRGYLPGIDSLEGMRGWFQVTDTYLTIHSYEDGDIYYYIFLDPLAQ